MKQQQLDNIAYHVRHILENIEPGIRPGTAETPMRVAKMYAEIFSGYGDDNLATGQIFLEKTFDDDVIEQYNGIIIVRDIPFVSMCEHHMCPFSGVAHVGYIPRGTPSWLERLQGVKQKGKVVGLSKLARLVRLYAARLQVQERLTEQVINDMQRYLDPTGAMVVMSAQHSCMSARGVRVHGTNTITSSVRGVFLTKREARDEFMSLLNVTHSHTNK